MDKLPCYKQATCCNNMDCSNLGVSPNEPCWGQVAVTNEIYTDDDWWWVHECEGHAGCSEGEKYKNK